MTAKPIKIALVCSTLNQLGGQAAHMRNFYRYLNGQGFEFTFILCSQNEPPLRNFMLDGGVNLKDIVFIPHAKKKLIFPFVLELRGIFLQEKFDIVHAFETQTQVLAGWAASWAGVKKFLCHTESQFLPSTISWPKRVLFRILNSFLKDYFTKTITVSSGLKNELIRNNFRPQEKVQLIHLGIIWTGPKNNQFSYPGLTSGTPIIGTISRLSIEKGLDRMIQAMPLVLNEIPAARFVIYGDGIQKEALVAQAKTSGVLEKIEFRAWAKDVPQALQNMEIFVMPSLREGLPITLLEAMSVGRLCVASDIEGVRDVIINGIDGILVDTSDAQIFADAITEVCREPKKAETMGMAAANKVQTYFNIEREIALIKELYQETVTS